MKLVLPNVVTPIYVKTDRDMVWPKDKLFYLLTANGLFLCRNHEWFQSCSQAKKGPGELELQEPFATVSYPAIPRLLLEKAVGFFRRVDQEHHWEAALILVWNRNTNAMELVCPDQKNSGGGVEYEIPKLPQHLALIGDIHSHPSFSATPSTIDKDDEDNRPGLHVIVGKINWPTPEFSCVTVIDGQRFTVAPEHVLEGYKDSDPAQAPAEWLGKVKAKYSGGGQYGSAYYGGSSYGGSDDNISHKDKAEYKRIRKDALNLAVQPTFEQVRMQLWSGTTCTNAWCDNKARDIIKEWHELHETQKA
jgi:PRTRC genetic system protein A